MQQLHHHPLVPTKEKDQTLQNQGHNNNQHQLKNSRFAANIQMRNFRKRKKLRNLIKRKVLRNYHLAHASKITRTMRWMVCQRKQMFAIYQMDIYSVLNVVHAKRNLLTNPISPKKNLRMKPFLIWKRLVFHVKILRQQKIFVVLFVCAGTVAFALAQKTVMLQHLGDLLGERGISFLF